MPSTDLATRVIIGLEVHVQLATRTKLLCGCPVEFGGSPNSAVCPVCLGLPGALPVLNHQAVQLAMRAGLALNCRVAGTTSWDRKSYFYPDLPKNYQVSQYSRPLCADGVIDLDSDGQSRRIRIQRAHLEEDAGKNLHDASGKTQVDLNRAGTPLLEIVTRPDLRSADETVALATELQHLVRWLGVSEGSMQKGHLRFEPTVNVAIGRRSTESRTPLAEIKNLNSFRALHAAIEYEVDRHVRIWLADRSYTQGNRPNENRGWNEGRGVTELQRTKEQEHDYRYFPDPDLVPLELGPARVERARSGLPESPAVKRTRFISEWRLTPAEADRLTQDRSMAELLERAVQADGSPQPLARQLVNIWARLANERGVDVGDLGLEPHRLAELARLVEQGTVSATAADTVAERMIDSAESPLELAKQLGLIQVTDPAELARWVDEALAANPTAVQTVLQNPKKAPAAMGFLRGQIMRCSGGRADAALAGELIARRIAALREEGS